VLGSEMSGRMYLAPWMELIKSVKTHGTYGLTIRWTYLDLIHGWRDLGVLLHFLQMSNSAALVRLRGSR
jgi:hypothetical protein